METTFNPLVSLYPTMYASDKGQAVSLRLVLAGIKYGRWSDFVSRVRVCEYKSKSYELAKSILPGFTACGVFLPGTRELTTLASPSYLVSMDFDRKDNKGRLDGARRMLEDDPYTWALGTSAGGQGFFVLVRVAQNPLLTEGWFDDLYDYYTLTYGVKADRGCRDICRLRYVSHDAELVIREQAELFVPAPLLGDAPRLRNPTTLAAARVYADGIDSSYDLEACVRLIEQRRVDLTEGDGRWVSLGYAFAGALGEYGREYFHRISVFHPRYKAGQCDRKYDWCLKKPSKVKLGKLFYLMRQEGLEPVRRDTYPISV